jgi:hypothetical protein
MLSMPIRTLMRLVGLLSLSSPQQVRSLSFLTTRLPSYSAQDEATDEFPMIEPLRLASHWIYGAICDNDLDLSCRDIQSDENPYEEFVIERLVSYGVDDDGHVLMRVRQCDFDFDDNT